MLQRLILCIFLFLSASTYDVTGQTCTMEERADTKVKDDSVSNAAVSSSVEDCKQQCLDDSTCAASQPVGGGSLCYLATSTTALDSSSGDTAYEKVCTQGTTWISEYGSTSVTEDSLATPTIGSSANEGTSETTKIETTSTKDGKTLPTKEKDSASTVFPVTSLVIMALVLPLYLN